jgi:hypothetical protein
VGELDQHAVAVVVKRLHGVVEDALHLALQRVPDRGGQVGAQDRDVSAAAVDQPEGLLSDQWSNGDLGRRHRERC